VTARIGRPQTPAADLSRERHAGRDLARITVRLPVDLVAWVDVEAARQLRTRERQVEALLRRAQGEYSSAARA
jgi:hypothetical protein